MSMHLESPRLNTVGKRNSKPKFRNAEEARRARELAASWAELQKKWAPKATIKDSKNNSTLKLDLGVTRSNLKNIPSLVTPGGDCTKKQSPQYTGTKMLGIGVMHKSNSVPIFSDTEAKDISTMRR